MKKFLLLSMMAILALTASAYDFKVNGLAYNYLNGQSGSEVQVTYTEYYSFSNYSGLTTANIPSSVTYNGTTYSVTSIGDRAFYNCRRLTSVNIGNSVTSIGEDAFYGCSGLTSVTIGNSVTSIGDYAFSWCEGLTSVTIPNSVTSIGGGIFSVCSGLESISVESGNTKYDSRINCNAIIESASNTLIAGCKNTVIPNSVTSIGNYAFLGCSGLTSVTIPNSVTSIGGRAFESCSGLTSVTIGNSVTSIGNSAFSYCSNLTSVTIPNSVTSIGNSAFCGCSGLTSVNFGNSMPTIGFMAFENTPFRERLEDVKREAKEKQQRQEREDRIIAARDAYVTKLPCFRSLSNAKITTGMKFSEIKEVHDYYFTEFDQIRKSIDRDYMPDYTPQFIESRGYENNCYIYKVTFMYRGNSYNTPVIWIWVRNNVVVGVKRTK